MEKIKAGLNSFGKAIAEFFGEFGHTFFDMILEIGIAILPILICVFVFKLILTKDSKKNIIKILRNSFDIFKAGFCENEQEWVIIPHHHAGAHCYFNSCFYLDTCPYQYS